MRIINLYMNDLISDCFASESELPEIIRYDSGNFIFQLDRLTVTSEVANYYSLGPIRTTSEMRTNAPIRRVCE